MSHTPKLLTLAAALVAAFLGALLPWRSKPPVAAQASSKGSFAMVAHLAVDGVAEIVAATPNGQPCFTPAPMPVCWAWWTSPTPTPLLLPRVDVRINGVGEPTSVAISPDGRFAVVALRMDDDVTIAPGALCVCLTSATHATPSR